MTGHDSFEDKSRRLGLILIPIATAVFVVQMYVGGNGPGPGWHGIGLALSAATLICVVALPLGTYLAGPRPGIAVALFVTGVVAALGLHLLSPRRPAEFMLVLLVGAATLRLPPRASAPVMVLAVGGFTAAVLGTGDRPGQLWSLVGMVAAYVVIVSGRNRRRTRRIEQQNLVLAERARIAREIHDILAHTLSAQLVHLEGAKLLTGAGRTDEAVDRIERARELARGGLAETRRALDTLRGENLKVDEALRELAAEHREAGGSCEVVLDGPVGELSAQAGLALVRTAQEALTNVRKHAPGADVTVRLRRDGDGCVLEVADTGGGTGAAAATGSGYGLVGMRERAELIGGALEAGPRGDGFAVVLRVPSR